MRYTLSGRQAKELDRGSGLLIALPITPTTPPLRGDWCEHGGDVDRWVCRVLPEASDAVVRSIQRPDQYEPWVWVIPGAHTGRDTLREMIGQVNPPEKSPFAVRVGAVIVYLCDRSGGGNGSTYPPAWPGGLIR